MKFPTFPVILFFWLTGFCLPAQAQFLADSNFIGTIRPVLENLRDIQKASTGSNEFVPPLIVPGESELETGALLLAVNNYDQTTGFEKLNSCVNDLILVQTWLKNKGIPEEQISVLADDAYLLPKAQAPLSRNFDNALKTITSKKYKQLIVFCACHGISLNGKSFLCPADTVKIPAPDQNADPVSLGKKHNLISIDYVISELQKSGAENVLLLLDACRKDGKGNFMEGFKDLQNNSSSLKRENNQLAVITACSFEQISHDLLHEPYGAFMYYFMDGLLCHRADYMWIYDGSTELLEAYYYAVAGTSQQFPNQIPMIFREKSCNFLLEKGSEQISTDEIAKTKSSLKFLLQTGSIFCNNRWADPVIKKGVDILDIVLKNSPNNLQAYALRGNAHRVLGNYDKALLDMIRINQKFQLYAHLTNDEPIQLIKNIKTKNIIKDLNIKKDDILTITQYGSDYYYVTEINNKKLGDKCGWIFKENICWKLRMSDDVKIPNEQSVGGSALGGTRHVTGGL